MKTKPTRVFDLRDPQRIKAIDRDARKLYRVTMHFDMSWGARSERRKLTKRTYFPKSLISSIRSLGYLHRGCFIPAGRLIEAHITEIVK